jgi:hypothetical protein
MTDDILQTVRESMTGVQLAAFRVVSNPTARRR